MNVEAQKPHWHSSGMLPLCARRGNTTGCFVWILSAQCLSTFISGEAWKINGLGIDFFAPSFSKHSQPPLRRLHLSVLSSQSVFSHLSSSTCTLAISFLHLHFYFSRCLYLSDLACAPYIGIGGGGGKALSDPLCFHFPRFLRGTDSIAACWWGWQWHLRVRLPLDACLLCFSRIPFPLTTAALDEIAISLWWKKCLCCVFGDDYDMCKDIYNCMITLKGSIKSAYRSSTHNIKVEGLITGTVMYIIYYRPSN